MCVVHCLCKRVVWCDQLQEPTTDDKLSKVFEKYTNGANEMDAKEFMHAINALFHTST